MQANTETKLSGADGLRAIACLLVIFHHFSQKMNMYEQSQTVRDVNLFFLQGNTGVSIFFILSGFLLSYPFWKKYLSNQQFPDMRQYTLRRAARIVPGYYVAMIICLIAVIVIKLPVEYLWQRFVAGMTFTAGFSYKTFFPSEINSPFWSISFEVFSYCIMPIFMLFLFMLTNKKRSFLKAIIYWAGVLVAILLLNRLVHTYLTPDQMRRGWEFGSVGGAKYWMPNYNPLGFFAQFIFGIFAAGFTANLTKIPDKLKKINRFFIVDIVALLMLISAGYLIYIMRNSRDFSFSFQNQPYYFPTFQFFVAFALALLPFTRIVSSVLDNGFFKLTAKLSFGLYVWHYTIMFFVTQYIAKDYVYGGITDITKLLIIDVSVLAVSYVIAAISYKFLEKPNLDWSHGIKFEKKYQNKDLNKVIEK